MSAQITLRDGTKLDLDDLSYIAFDHPGIVIVKGWTDELKQTYDEFPLDDSPQAIKIIHLFGEEEDD